MSHAAEYLIVAGVAWLRRSTEADWAVTGPGVSVDNASYEIAVRSRLPELESDA